MDESTDSEFDPDNHSGRLLVAKGVTLAQGSDGLERSLRQQGFGPPMTFEEYCKQTNENLEFTSYSVQVLDGWCYVWAGDAKPQELSLEWNALVCEARQIEHTWRLAIFEGGKLLGRHASHAEVYPGFEQLRHVMGHESDAVDLGDPRQLARAFGVTEEEIAPYFYHLSVAEDAALGLLADGFGSRLAAPLLPGDLRRPGDGWHVIDLVRRLGARGVDKVIRCQLERAEERWACRPRVQERREERSNDELIAQYVTEARCGLDCADPRRQLACAQFLFGSHDPNTLDVIRKIARREDSLGAEALHFLASQGLTETLWELFRDPKGLPPLERAAVLRHIARADDRGMLEAVASCLEDTSLLVRLEAIEAYAHLRGSADDERLTRLARSLNPFERVTARAAMAAIAPVPPQAELEIGGDAPSFTAEIVPLRRGQLTLRHHREHLKVRRESLMFLASVRHTGHEVHETPWELTGHIPYLKDVLSKARELGVEPEVTSDVDLGFLVWTPTFDTDVVPLWRIFDAAIRSAAGVLSVRAEGRRVLISRPA